MFRRVHRDCLKSSAPTYFKYPIQNNGLRLSVTLKSRSFPYWHPIYLRLKQPLWQARDLWSTYSVRVSGCWLIFSYIQRCKKYFEFMPPSEPCGLIVLYSASQWLITTRASVIELNSQRSKHVVRNISGLPEAFAVTVLPRAAWIGVMDIHLFVLQRFLHCWRNHFGSGVAAQARWATISRKRCSMKRFSRTSIDVTSGQTAANR